MKNSKKSEFRPKFGKKKYENWAWMSVGKFQPISSRPSVISSQTPSSPKAAIFFSFSWRCWLTPWLRLSTIGSIFSNATNQRQGRKYFRLYAQVQREIHIFEEKSEFWPFWGDFQNFQEIFDSRLKWQKYCTKKISYFFLFWAENHRKRVPFSWLWAK